MEEFLVEPGRIRGGKSEEQAGQWVVTNILCDTEQQGRYRENGDVVSIPKVQIPDFCQPS